MFHYPITVPHGTLYDELEIGPDATSDEVDDARVTQLDRINQEERQIQERLKDIYGQVDGLKDAIQRFERLSDSADGHTELPRARDELTRLERSAERIDPDYKELRDRVQKLSRRKVELNQVDLQNRAQRNEYDAARPPCDLLKLERDLRNPFSVSEELDLERRLALALIRRELTAFLIESGEDVYHPSDLTREDFSGDYAFHPLLDAPAP